jgi:hypothetical protein
MEYAMHSSGWTVLDSVDDMFKNAKLRVYSESGSNNCFINNKKIIRVISFYKLFKLQLYNYRYTTGTKSKMVSYIRYTNRNSS